MKIDLQIQTTASDGRDTPTKVIELAKKSKVDVLAITDHDSIDGIKEAEKAAEGSKLKIIPGIEISSTLHGKRIHVLGYGIDHKNEKLQEFLAKLYKQMKDHFIELLPEVNNRLKAAGHKTVPVEKYKNLPKQYYRMPGLATYMRDEGAVPDLASGFPFIEKLKPLILHVAPSDAIHIIHEASGKAVLSHPFAPKISLNNISQDHEEQEAILEEMIAEGLDGLECITPCHGKPEQERVRKYALKYKLGITAGTDWHGHISDTGTHILEYIPHYAKEIGDLDISDSEAKAIIEWIES